MYLLRIILAAALTGNFVHGSSSKLLEVFRWREVDFKFANASIRTDMIQSGKYVPAANSILGLGVWHYKLFLTVPRWYPGVVSTLNYIRIDTYKQSPELIPYPDYESNDIYNGNLDKKIISTSRIYIDKCNRLWVPDNGMEGIFTSSPKILAPQKLLVYDVITNTLLRSIVIGDDVKRLGSMFYEVIVEENNDCEKVYAYLADTTGYGIVVYSWESNTLTRVSNSYMYFEPASSILGKNSQFSDGVMGMALSPANNDGFRTFYFHALASSNEYNVSTQVLKDPTLASDFHNFQLMGSRGLNGQSSNQRFHEESGIMFYTLLKKNAIGCWNSNQYPGEYNPDTNGIAALDRDKLTFPSALTLDNHDNVWVISNNLLNFGGPDYHPFEFNTRIFRSPIPILVKDTVCDGKIPYSL